MPSLENLNLSQQATTLLSNVRRDLRSECATLKARLDANEWTAAYVQVQANNQGNALVALLQKLADHQAAVEAALLEWSVPVQDTRDDYNLLRTAAEAMRDATAANVSATLTQILSQVPAKTRIW